MKHKMLEFDVVVAGGGPGGVPAAIAAARGGAKTLLVEKNGYLGGNLSIGLPMLGFLDRWGHQVTAGFAQEYVDRLRKRGACSEHTRCPMHNSITLYHHDISKMVLMEMCREAGVEVLLHTEVIASGVENGRLKNITLFGKGTCIHVGARVFIDATGDGDMAYMAGAEYEMGQKGSGVLQPPTLMFSVGGVDEEGLFRFLETDPEQMRLSDTIEVDPGYNAAHFRSTRNYTIVGLRKLFLEMREKGELPVSRDTFIAINSLLPGEHNINCTRHQGTDGSDLFDLTRAEAEGLVQVEKLVEFMRRHIPGYENCYITRIFPFMGIRETRRFIGKQMLTEDSILTGDIPADSIGLGSYIIDIHDGQGMGTIVKKIEAYGIPYGCTLAKDIEGLMFAGRCASLDAVVMSSARVMPTCMVIGEGAGVGAGLAVKHGISPSEVDAEEVRSMLRASGAILEASW